MSGDVHKQAMDVAKAIVKGDGKNRLTICNMEWPAQFSDSNYRDSVIIQLQNGIAGHVSRTFAEKTEEKPKRKYYGCKHCGSMQLKTLKSHCGDPEGIRNDSQCEVCGGIQGSCKSSSTYIDREEWSAEHDEPYPTPDLMKVAIMKALVSVEETSNVDLRDLECALVTAIQTKVQEHVKQVYEYDRNLKARVELLRAVLNGSQVTLYDRNSLDSVTRLLESIDRVGGLRKGGEEYPNALNVHDAIDKLKKLHLPSEE